MRTGNRRPALEQRRRRSRNASEGSSDGSGSSSASGLGSTAPGAERPDGEDLLGDAALSEMLSRRRVRRAFLSLTSSVHWLRCDQARISRAEMPHPTSCGWVTTFGADRS